jgi:hypothetical protein
MIPGLVVSALLHRWRVRGQVNLRERQNWNDDTRVMPSVPQNENVSYQDLAMHIVILKLEDELPPETFENPAFGIYVVWFCKTLQNWKALVCTTLEDNMYYEVTHNGDLRETYVDTYTKTDNRKFLDSEI